MRLLTLNIRHGGGKRIPGIVEFLANSAADVIVLSEFRAGPPGEKIEAALHDLGYTHRRASVTEPRINGVMVASRIEAEPISLAIPDTDAARIAGCRIGDLQVFGVYFALFADKLGLFEFIEAHSAEWTRGPAILMGDFNTGRHWMDETKATYKLADHFVGLEEDHGWTDMWRHFHGRDAREFTWYSHKANGFRLDHAFASAAAKRLITSVEYEHNPRPTLTDHSAMILDLA